ncbi:MAG: hypothetical protein QXK37_05085 [Candidatus Woesearchaeota archaeon]
MDDFNIDFSSPLSTPLKSYYCYDCHLELIVVSEKEARCQKCGATGHRLVFRCPGCNNTITVFHPDQRSDIHCFCN